VISKWRTASVIGDFFPVWISRGNTASGSMFPF
jgi:hypothetical protein